MIAVDTNVIVRLLVADDSAQSSKARALFEREDIWIGTTVLLETAWVLEAVYELPIERVIKGLRAVLGLPNVSTENPAALALALDAAATGLDLADALHLCFAPAAAESFVTFDRRLQRRGSSLRPIVLA